MLSSGSWQVHAESEQSCRLPHLDTRQDNHCLYLEASLTHARQTCIHLWNLVQHILCPLLQDRLGAALSVELLQICMHGNRIFLFMAASLMRFTVSCDVALV